ncbi:Uncharacterized protein Adt_18242 [Abeliophyllum distichum]|uniref:Uncharacterized protein n=1 Tax=Abeliophyllum distichum TaxID=126358 RepID=A0ABD1TIU5_9LAMI
MGVLICLSLVVANPSHESSVLVESVNSDASSSMVLRLLNIQASYSHHGKLIKLDLLMNGTAYNIKSFEKMLKKYEFSSSHSYRVPGPSERITGSDPREVIVYCDSMTADLRFPLHSLFVSFFN